MLHHQANEPVRQEASQKFAPGGATSAQIEKGKELDSLSTSSGANIQGIDIVTGFNALTLVEDAVRDGILLVERGQRLAVINAYVFAAQSTANSLAMLLNKLQREGEL